MVPTALVELEHRAGASDADRPAWLAERHGGITATEIRDLMIGAVKEDDLIAVKLGWREEPANLGNIPVIRWGRRREPVIAETIRLQFAIAPESRVLRAIDNDRFLASPDGTGCTFDGALLVSEIKTAGVDISPTSAAFVKKGYLFQVIWVMRVTGARRCLFAWEERIEVAPGRFEAGELHFHWIDYDDAIAEQLEVVASDFLAHLDAATTTHELGDPTALENEKAGME